jgi:hypothetical protein
MNAGVWSGPSGASEDFPLRAFACQTSAVTGQNLIDLTAWFASCVPHSSTIQGVRTDLPRRRTLVPMDHPDAGPFPRRHPGYPASAPVQSSQFRSAPAIRSQPREAVPGHHAANGRARGHPSEGGKTRCSSETQECPSVELRERWEIRPIDRPLDSGIAEPARTRRHRKTDRPRPDWRRRFGTQSPDSRRGIATI